jgi:hypothetical protein
MKNILLFLLVFLALTASVSAGSVTRSLSDSDPEIEEEITITLDVLIDPEDLSYTIEETIPSGIEIIDEGDGNYNSEQRKLRWIEISGIQDTTKTYTIKLLSENKFTLQGIYAFNITELDIQGETEIGSGPSTPTDSDSDGVPDSTDSCANTPSGSSVNAKGCPLPTATNFDIKPDFSSLDLSTLSNFEIGISKVGRISYSSSTSLLKNSAALDLDSNLLISKNRIELKSNNLPSLNKSAIITLEKTDLTKPLVFTNGQNCTACQITSWNNNTKNITFSVPHFTIYTLVEGNSSQSNNRNNDDQNNNNRNKNSGTSCTPSWSCSWSSCINNQQSTSCIDRNNCGTTSGKPTIINKTCQTSTGNQGSTNTSQNNDTQTPPDEISKGEKIFIFILILVSILILIIIAFLFMKIRAQNKPSNITGENPRVIINTNAQNGI